MNWEFLNRERARLIDLAIAGTIRPHEQKRLDALNEAADEHLRRVAPRPVDALEELEQRLKEPKA